MLVFHLKREKRKNKIITLNMIEGMVFGDSEQSGIRRGMSSFMALLIFYVFTNQLGRLLILQ